MADTELAWNMQNGLDQQITVDFREDLAVLTMNRGENRVNVDFVNRFQSALDTIERNKSVKAVVITGQGKFFCNGYDLEWRKHITPRQFQEFGAISVGNLLCRLATFPLPTIAAINGHAFALGAILSLVCDCRLQNEDRGWWCLNEVHIGMTFRSSFTFLAILRRCLPSGPVYHEAVVLGHRYTGAEAVRAGIVHRTARLVGNGDVLVQEAAKEANRIGAISRESLQNMKEAIYEDIIAAKETQLAQLSKI